MDFARCPTQTTPRIEPFYRFFMGPSILTLDWSLNVVKSIHPGPREKHVSFDWEQPRDHDFGSNRIQGSVLVQWYEMIVLVSKSWPTGWNRISFLQIWISFREPSLNVPTSVFLWELTCGCSEDWPLSMYCVLYFRGSDHSFRWPSRRLTTVHVLCVVF